MHTRREAHTAYVSGCAKIRLIHGYKLHKLLQFTFRARASAKVSVALCVKRKNLIKKNNCAERAELKSEAGNLQNYSDFGCNDITLLQRVLVFIFYCYGILPLGMEIKNMTS